MQITCEATGQSVEVKETAKGNPKLPKGWKWRGEKVYSAAAWQSLYCLRAITVPVVSPVVEHAGPEELRAAWGVLNEQLKDAWQHSTEAANWAVKYLWSHDATRQADAAKCPKMQPIYLYALRDWTGWSQSAGAVLRTVESQYRKKRYEIVWTGSAGVPNVRYPYPYPIHNASWGLGQMPGGQMIFDCRLPLGRVSVRVRTKDKSRARMADLMHLAKNPDLRGEAALIRKTDGTIMVKMVGWFPKTIREQNGELLVKTSQTHLITLFNEREERLMVFNGDWIKQKVAGHAAMLERWSDDQKLESRIPKRRGRKTQEDMKAACLKMNNRLKSFVDETAAKIVNYAIRRKLAVIRYDDTETGYFVSFPWFKLRTQLESVCQREGLRFESIGADPEPDTARSHVTSTEETE